MDYFLLFLPLVFWTCISLIINMKHSLVLNEKNLSRQPLFWLSIIVPVSLFFYFGFFSWRGHQVLLNGDGIINFYNISKTPLLLLASSVPLAGMTANLHRTIQTEVQILETRKKNASDRYYSHLKFYTEAFSKIPSHHLESRNKNKEIAISDFFNIYRNIFLNSNESGIDPVSINAVFFDEMYNLWDELNKYILEYINTRSEYNQAQTADKFFLLFKSILKIENKFINICNHMSISCYHYNLCAIYNIRFTDNKSTVRKTLHSGFLSHADMRESIEAVEKISLRVIDIVNPEKLNDEITKNRRLLNNINWVIFSIYDSLVMAEFRDVIPYAGPRFKD